MVCNDCKVCDNYLVCENGCFGSEKPCEFFRNDYQETLESIKRDMY